MLHCRPFWSLSLSLSLSSILIQSLLLCFHFSRRIWFSGSECKHHNQMGCDDMGERRLHCTLFVTFFLTSSCSNNPHKPQNPQTDLQLNISPFDLHARWIVCLSVCLSVSLTHTEQKQKQKQSRILRRRSSSACMHASFLFADGFVCVCAGKRDVVQLATISAHRASWVDSKLDMGVQGSDLDNAGSRSDDARRLFTVPQRYTTQLRSQSEHRGPLTGSPLQPTSRQLLSRRSSRLFCTGSRQRHRRFPDHRR